MTASQRGVKPHRGGRNLPRLLFLASAFFAAFCSSPIAPSTAAAVGPVPSEVQSEPTISTNNKGDMYFNVGLGNDVFLSRQSNATGTVTTTPSPVITQAQLDVVVATWSTALVQETSRASAAEGSLLALLTVVNSTLSLFQIQTASSLSSTNGAEASLSTVLNTEVSSVLNAQNTGISTERSRALYAEGSLSISLSVEIQRATGIDSSLGTNAAGVLNTLNGEIQRAIGSEASISVVMSAQANANSNVQAALSFAVSSERSRAIVAEGSVAVSVSNEATRATGVENNLNTAINSEASRAVGIEGSVSVSVLVERSRAIVTEGSLGVSVSNEVGRATGVENNLNTAINSEASRAVGIEGSVSVSVLVERSRAVFVENSVSASLGSEISRATFTEGSVAASVFVERSRAIVAEGSVAVSVSNEVTRATGVENNLNTAINSEASRAVSVENSVSISVLVERSRAILAESSVSAALGVEFSRAVGVENSVANSVQVERSRALVAEGSLSVLLRPFTSCTDALRYGYLPVASGVFYINYGDGNGPVRVYCDQTSYGGGWDLVMKMSAGATTFPYTSPYWSTANLLNQAYNIDGTFGTDNKFVGYNSGGFNQILVRFNFGGTTWDWPITTMSASTQTPLNYFTTPGGIFFGNQIGTGYFTNGGTKWSSQVGYQNFGVNVCCPGNGAGCTRMGFLWNNEATCDSNDVSGGLGLASNFRSYSAGDALGCCPIVTGANAAFNAQIFARALRPATSCMDVLRNGYTTSGAYLMDYGTGGPVLAYCDMTSYSGGWDLIMKMSAGTVTFPYSSNLWTTTNMLNQVFNLDASFGSDNKYNGYNFGLYTQILVRFNLGAATWDWPITTMATVAQTPLSYFTTSGGIFFNGGMLGSASVTTSAYFTNGGSKFSSQTGYQAFGVNVCCSNGAACTRMGFLFNNEGTCDSNDNAGGLGLAIRGYSAGDVNNCCPGVSGANTAFNAQIFARR